MITFQTKNEETAHRISLLDCTLFRTKPTHIAARPVCTDGITVRKMRPAPCYTLLFGQVGTLLVSTKKGTFSLTPHSLLLIEPHFSFSIKAEDRRISCFYAVEFEADDALSSHFKIKSGDVFLENAKSLKEYFDELHAIPDDRNTYAETLLLLLLEKIRDLTRGKNDAHLLYSHVIKRIRLHLTDAPSTALIAFGSHYSVDHLTKLLKRSHALTLSAMIKRERLKILKSYLRFTTFSPEYIADLLAFPTLPAMLGFFKYHTGISLEEYRKKFTEPLLKEKGKNP